MRFASFTTGSDGRPRLGLMARDGRLIDLSAVLEQPSLTLRSLLAGGLLPRLRSIPIEKGAVATDDVRFLPVVHDPGKIVCVGLNYAAHAQESRMATAKYPLLFLRVAGSQVGHKCPLLVPPESDQLDYEGELAVVIGYAGRRIREQDALRHVAGYACYNDASVRDWQVHTSQFTPGKNFSATGAFGPYFVTADEVGDPGDLQLTTRLNGVVVQSANTRQMLFSIPQLIAYVSTFVELEPGDVIVSGTPDGVGMARTPPLYMKDGDTVEVEIERVGTLVNPVRAEAAQQTR